MTIFANWESIELLEEHQVFEGRQLSSFHFPGKLGFCGVNIFLHKMVAERGCSTNGFLHLQSLVTSDQLSANTRSKKPGLGSLGNNEVS